MGYLLPRRVFAFMDCITLTGSILGNFCKISNFKGFTTVKIFKISKFITKHPFTIFRNLGRVYKISNFVVTLLFVLIQGLIPYILHHVIISILIISDQGLRPIVIFNRNLMISGCIY